jgi:hypothetical protein
MPISTWSVAALAVIVALNTLFLAGMAVALFLINRKLDEALTRLDPLIKQAESSLQRIDAAAGEALAKLDTALTRTTELVVRVSDRVDTTTAIAEEAVTEPLIGAASLMAGIQRGLETLSAQSREAGGSEERPAS